MDFQKEVIEESKNQPIVVDFWAPWCGPCQFLGPVLEELDQSQDRWKLVKVNVDENQEVSAQFGIRGIPDVRLFVNGEVKDGFTGALPKHQIEKWLEKNIPDERLEELNTLVRDLESNVQQLNTLREFVKKNPDLKEGQIALAKIIVLTNPDEANTLISSIPPGHEHEELATAIRYIAHFLTAEMTSTNSPAEKLIEAQEHLANGDFERALPLIIESVAINKSFMDDLPRKTSIGLFNYLGPGHPLTKAYRRKFDMYLY